MAITYRCWQEHPDNDDDATILALANDLDSMHHDDLAKLQMDPFIASLPAKDPNRRAHALVAKRARKRLYNRMTRTFDRHLSRSVPIPVHATGCS